MERRLFTNSICLCLVLAFASMAIAQNVKPRESGDPYFQTKNSWNASGGGSQSNLQPRLRQAPVSSQLAPRQAQLQPQTKRYSLTNELSNQSQPASQLQPAGMPSANAQLKPRQPLTYQNSTNNDFRPRSVQSSQLDELRFSDDKNSFRPRESATTERQLQPISPASPRKPLFEEVVPSKAINFEQSEEFETPKNNRAMKPVQPERRPPSNPQRDFAQVTSTGANMLTGSQIAVDNQNGDEFEPGRVVAIVGGKPIFVGDMLFEVNQFLEKVNPNAPEQVRAAQRKMVIKKMIPKFIDQKLLLIDTLNSLPPEADFESVVESAQGDFDEKVLPTVMEQSDAASALELDAKLRAQGGSLRQLRYKWAEEQLIKYFIGQKLNVDTDIGHQEMLTDYQANLEQYHRKAKVRWEELAIRFDKVPNRDEAERLLKKMGNEVVYGASFAAVAKDSSQGFTASEGGQHDWTSKGALVYKDVERALFSIPTNELSDVIPSRDGFHIVRVLERTEESYTPFLDAQTEIREKLENEKRGKAFEDHIAKLRKRIPFEIQLEDVELPEHLADQGRDIR